MRWHDLMPSRRNEPTPPSRPHGRDLLTILGGARLVVLRDLMQWRERMAGRWAALGEPRMAAIHYTEYRRLRREIEQLEAELEGRTHG